MKYAMLDTKKVINNIICYQIVCLKDIYDGDRLVIKQGELGGFIASENDLNQNDSNWLKPNEFIINGKKGCFNDKYKMLGPELTPHGKLYRIEALKDFGDVKKGDIGGYIANSHNLAVEGDCWVYPDAIVKDNARVSGNAKIYDRAIVKNYAHVSDDAIVKNCAQVIGKAKVSGKVVIEELAIVKKNVHGINYPILGGNKIYRRNLSNRLNNGKDSSFSVFKNTGKIAWRLAAIIFLILFMSSLYNRFVSNGVVEFILLLPSIITIGILVASTGLEIWATYHLYIQEYKESSLIENRLVKYQHNRAIKNTILTILALSMTVFLPITICIIEVVVVGVLLVIYFIAVILFAIFILMAQIFGSIF